MSDELNTENTGQQKEEKRSKIPGFRSGKLWKKLTAVIGYAFIGLFILVLFVDGKGANNTGGNNNPPDKSPAEISQAAYVAAIEAYNNKDYDKALKLLSDVIKDDSNYADAQSKIKEINNLKANNCLERAKTNLQVNNFDLALSDIDNALEYNPNLQEAATLREQATKQKAAFEQRKKQKEIADYKNSCQVLSYKVLNKNPDSFIGKKVKLRGEIMQIQEDNGETFMLLSITNLGYDVWSDNVAVYYNGTADVYEDDIITIWGEVTGSFSYKSRAGWDLTVPGVNAKYIAKG